MLAFFFFKQKTAYEMRISDWSSDVCSSDLRPGLTSPHAGINRAEGGLFSRLRDGSDPGRRSVHGLRKQRPPAARTRLVSTQASALRFLIKRSSDNESSTRRPGRGMRKAGHGWPAADRKSTRLNSSH